VGDRLSSGAAEQASSTPQGEATAVENALGSAGVIVESRQRIMVKRILVWLLFGAIFGLMPLFAVGIKEAFSKNGFNIDQLLQGGDLFIVAAVLAAGALGELLAAASKGMNFYAAIIAGFFCLAAFAGDTIAFLVAGSAPASEVATASLWFFPLTLLTSGLCVGTAAYG
jgi:hypothetical protein